MTDFVNLYNQNAKLVDENTELKQKVESLTTSLDLVLDRLNNLNAIVYQFYQSIDSTSTPTQAGTAQQAYDYLFNNLGSVAAPIQTPLTL